MSPLRRLLSGDGNTLTAPRGFIQLIVSLAMILLPQASLSDDGRGVRLSSSLVEEASSNYTGSYALLIGQSQYNNGWSNLDSIPGELDELEGALRLHDFNVTRIENLPGSKLKAAIGNFLENFGYDEGNRLLIFYAGHGYSVPGGSRGYLVPVDAPLPTENAKRFRQVAMTMSEILGDMRSIDARHVMVLFDSCFSGSIFKTRGAGIENTGISKLIKEPVRQFVTSGSAGEEVPAKSVFVPVLVDALDSGVADSNADGYTTGSELGAFIQNSFLSYGEQTPQVGKINDYELSRGDFVFQHEGGPRKEKAALAPSTLRTTFPDWFFNPVVEKGVVATAAAESEEAAIISAIFDLSQQELDTSEKVKFRTEDTGTAERADLSDSLDATTYTSAFRRYFGHSIMSSGTTETQLFPDGSSSIEKLHEVVVGVDDSSRLRMYKTSSRSESQAALQEHYEVTSSGASYQDFRRHLLRSGFDIRSETVLIEGRRLQAILLSWDPDYETLSQ